MISFVAKVTRSVNTSDGEMSPQEEKTIKSIADARLSLVDRLNLLYIPMLQLTLRNI